jgi:hypothetical protein
MNAQEFLNRLTLLGETPPRTALVMFLPLTQVEAHRIAELLKTSKIESIMDRSVATAQDVKQFVDAVKDLQRLKP